MTALRFAPAILFALALLCPGAAHAADTGSVEGKITIDGNPVAKGKVAFHPARGKAVEVKIAADGTYNAKKVPVGEVKITVKGPGVPKKFESVNTSGLTLTVEKGKSQHNIDLRK
jgi:hypothetical protein